MVELQDHLLSTYRMILTNFSENIVLHICLQNPILSGMKTLLHRPTICVSFICNLQVSTMSKVNNLNSKMYLRAICVYIHVC